MTPPPPVAPPVAVVGLAGRFPGADGLDAYWDALVTGTELVRTIPEDELRALGVPEHVLRDPRFVPASPVLDGIEEFDAAFFGSTPREAELRDPQHRLFLETAHTALEHAGLDPARPGGRIGVFAGVKENDYLARVLRADPHLDDRLDGMTLGVANDHDFVATLASYALDLRGPSMTVNSACSTSLVAVHLACRALAAGDCEVAIAGAASLEIPQGRGYLAMEGGVLSPDGHCRPFSADAAGTMWGSGVAAVVLMPLDAALAAGHTVHAVLLGSALSNDGAGKAGFTAPGEDGQVAAVSDALRGAGIDPRTVSYVEAHGTGTRLGDPVEVAALTRAYASGDDRQWCLLGSVKGNAGHLVAAAGLAGLVKTVLALEHGTVPPTLHAERPNPLMDLPATPFRLATSATPWPRTPGAPRRAGVSAFGIGGTNAHVVLEEAPEVPAVPSTAPRHLLPFSAKAGAARDEALVRLGRHLGAHPGTDLGDVAHTLQVGRGEHPHRAVLVASGPADAAHALLAPDRRRIRTARVPATAPRVALLFTGQGAQHPGMARGAYDTWPAFRDALDTCADLLAEPLGRDLRDALWPGDAAELARTGLTQPALFAVEWATAALWRSWGVEPAAAVGHSVGELVAATVAGVFALPDALALVALRGRLMQAMPPGAMLSVGLDEAEVELPPALTVAAVNAPGTCVVAGPVGDVEAYAAELAARGGAATRLRTSHAFHSAMMDPVVDAFAAAVATVPRRAPRLPFPSNTTGEWITDEQAVDPAYWGRHVRAPVRFAQCLTTLLGGEPDGWALVEAGPGRTLADLARRTAGRGAPAPLPTLPPAHDGDPARDADTALTALGELWLRGVAVDWAGVTGPDRRRIPLPTYAFQRRRHWAAAPDTAPGTAPGTTAAPAVPAPTGPPAPADRFSVPGWAQAAPVVAPVPVDGPVVVVADAGTPGDALADRLAADGARVVRVRAGAGFEWPAADEVVVDPAERDDWSWLLDGLAESGLLPARVVDATGLTGGGDPAADADRTLRRLLALGQALAGGPAPDVELVVLTAGAHDVRGDDLTAPGLAVVAGPCRVLPLESPRIRCRHVDVDRPDPGALRTELGAPDADPVVALRGGRRWLPTTQPVHLDEGDPAAGLRPGGTWLVTGGLGGVGLAVAEHLARRSGARVALLGRTAPPARAAAAVRRVRAAGGNALTCTADVTDADALRRVRAEVEARFGPVTGIVHAAGLPGGGLVELTDAATVAAVVAPKIGGTLALAAVFGDLPLDAFVLCSSVAALTGGLGQVDYVAANAFLDAYARSADRPVATTLSIGWGAWLETGMYAAWRRGAPAAPAADEEPADGGAHPWLPRRRDEPDGAVVLGGDLSAAQWVLDEHRLDGVPVLPGTAMAELLLAGARAAGAAAALRDVRFLAPLAVPDGTAARIEVTVAAADGARSLALRSYPDSSVPDDGPLVVHAVATTDVATAARHVDLTAPADAGAGRPPFDEPWLAFGPRWSSVHGVADGPGGEVATLVAPPEATAELGSFTVHPALLDAATACGRGADTGGERFLPVGYDRIEVLGPLPERFHAVLRPAGAGDGERRTDVVLTGPDGAEVVRLDGFTLRAVAPAAAPPPGGPGLLPTEGAEALRRVLAAGLGPHVLVSAVPLEEMRDGLRPAAPEPAAGEAAPADRDGLDPYVAPRTELEHRLAALWAEALGVGDIGVEDDYFGLGGNSMAGVHLLWRVGEVLGVTLTMRHLFDAPTIAGMAEAVGQVRAQGPAPVPEPIEIVPRS